MTISMNRREFLEAAGSAVAGASLLNLPLVGLASAGPLLPSRLIPEDKGFTPAQLASLRLRGERRIYRGAQRYAIGMPCGGVAAGQLYVMGDGTLGGWRIDGRLNGTGYGGVAYQTRRPPKQLVQGFRLVVGDGPAEQRRYTLADVADGGAYDSIEFVGEYPVAEIRYAHSDVTRVPPLDVTLRVGSPFIPLNSRDSAMPCTILRFTLRNRSSRPITGALQGWLQNGVEPAESGRPSALRRNRVVRVEPLTTVLMDAIADQQDNVARPDRVLFDFEQDTYAHWTTDGEAFGGGPARGTQPDQNPVTGFAGERLVNSYPGSDAPTGRLMCEPFNIDRRYMTFLIGGGRDAQRTCMHLLVDGQVVRTATGANNERLEPDAWDVSEFEGKPGILQIFDAASGPWGHINVDQIALVDRLPEPLQRPRPDSLSNGTMALSYLGDGHASAAFDPASPAEAEGRDEVVGARDEAPVGMVDASFTLKPGESRELAFVVSWHFPNLHTNNGQMYANWFADAREVAAYVAKELPRLVAHTELFRRTAYEDTTLPWWLALRLIMPVSTLATGTYQWWKNGRAWGWEGVGCCHGTCTHVWNYSQAEARLFPDMSRSTRMMQDLGTALEESTGRVAFRGEVDKGFAFAADGQAGTVLKCLREHLQSKDEAFLKANWPRIRKVMEYMIARDAEQSSDGKPDGVLWGHQHNTYDIDFVGANTFVGSLYLAALFAAERMAGSMGDFMMAQRCRDIAAAGRAWTETNLFNGEYFVQKLPPGDNTPWQYGDGCLADQLFGQNWARSLDLETVYDEQKVRTALRSIYRYAWSPNVGTYNAEFPPERVFARDREGGLFVATWPKGGRPGEPVRYRDEVWTGIEYQVAAGMMWEGLADEALVMVKAIDDRYDGALHNPWNEVECGDHYSRAMASWSVLLALTGYLYDGPQGVMGMSPRITPEDFAALFTAAEGWGRIVQKRAERSQINRVEVRWGSVRLSTFIATLPDGIDDSRLQCTASIDGAAVPATIERRSDRVLARFESAATISADHALEVRWTW